MRDEMNGIVLLDGLDICHVADGLEYIIHRWLKEELPVEWYPTMVIAYNLYTIMMIQTLHNRFDRFAVKMNNAIHPGDILVGVNLRFGSKCAIAYYDLV